MQTVRCRRWISLLLAAILLLSTPGLSAQAADDTTGHWCQEEMDAFAQLGILSGDGSGRMRPNAPVTRAEFVKLLNGVFGFQPTGAASFTDAAPDSWYSGHAAAGIRAGYLSGYPDGTFRPGNPITRQEAAKMVVFVLNESVSAGKTTFVDDSQISSWARGYVKAAAALDVLGGYPDGTFRPHNHITRAETVKLLSNAVPGIYIKAGTYSGTVDGNAVVGAAGITLENMVIRGNLYITEGAAGSILLDNVQVDGRIIITGSADRTVEMIDSDIERIEVKSSAENTKLIIGKGTQVDTIVVEAPVEIEVQKGGHVDRIENHATGTAIFGKGTVDEIIAHQETVVDGKTYPAGSETDLNKGSSGGGSRPPYRPVPKPDPEPDPEPEPEGYVLTAAVDKRQQEITQGNQVTGRLTNNGEGVANTAITMVIRCMGDGKAAILDQGITDSDGRFTASFQMPEGSQAGDYQVRLYAQSPAARSWTGAFTVQGQPASSDLSALAALIQQAESAHPETSREQYTSDSWADFASALMAAKAVADDPTAPQSLVNSAEAALRQAMGGLIRRADKSELEAAIAKAEALNQNNYTAESWAELEKALAAGKETMADKDISQAKVNKAAEDIRKAIEGLKDINSVNATLLLKGQAVAPDFTYRALLDAGKAFPNSGDTLIWKTTGNGTGDLTVTAVSSDNAVLSVSVGNDASAKVTGTVDTLGNAVITLKTVWGADTVEQSMAVTVVNKSTVDRLAAAISVAGEFKQSAFSPELWNQFTPVFDHAKAAYADNAAAEAALLQAAEALEAQNEKLLEASKSSIVVSLKDSKKNDLPKPFKMYSSDNPVIYVFSATSKENVQSITATLDDPAGQLGFYPLAFGPYVDKSQWQVTCNIAKPGTYTLSVTVHFANGKHTTVSHPCEVYTKPNKAELADVIKKAEKRIEDQFTEETWTLFAAALETAKTVNKSDYFCSQTEVDSACKALAEALKNLKLKNPIDENSWNLDWYQGSDPTSTEPVPSLVEAITTTIIPKNGHTFWLNVTGLQEGQVDSVKVSWTPAEGLKKTNSIEGTSSTNPHVYRWKFYGTVNQPGMVTVTATVTLIDGQEKEASFQVKVLPLPTTNKDALNDLIFQVKGEMENEDLYTADSWKAFKSAFQNAESVSKDPAKTQDEVNAAKDALQTAYNNLDPKDKIDPSTWDISWSVGVNPSASTPISGGITVQQGDFIAQGKSACWLKVTGTAVTKKIASVKVTYSPENLLTDVESAEITPDFTTYVYGHKFNGKMAGEGTVTVTARVTLTDRSYKEKSFTVTTKAGNDKTELKALIAEASGKKQYQYTDDSWNALQAALEKAKSVADDVAATESAITEAVTALQTAIDGLTSRPDPLPPISVKLTTTNGGELANPLRIRPYSSQSLNVVSDTTPDAVADISATIAPENSTFKFNIQKWTPANNRTAEIRIDTVGKYIVTITVTFADGRTTSIDLPIEAIKTADISKLITAIDAAEKKVQENYDPITWSAFETALQNAKKVKAAISTQEEIDAALAQLNSTMDALHVTVQVPDTWDIAWYMDAENGTIPVPDDLTVYSGKEIPTSGKFWLTMTDIPNKGVIDSIDITNTPTEAFSFFSKNTAIETDSTSPTTHRLSRNGRINSGWTGNVTIKAKVTLITNETREASFTVHVEPAPPRITLTTGFSPLKNVKFDCNTEFQFQVNTSSTDGSTITVQNLTASIEGLTDSDFTFTPSDKPNVKKNQWPVTLVVKTPGKYTLTITVHLDDGRTYDVKLPFEAVGAVNKTDLNAAITSAEEIFAKGGDGYTPDSWSAFTAALEDARKVSAAADATQPQVDAARDALTKAQDELQPATPDPGPGPSQEIKDIGLVYDGSGSFIIMGTTGGEYPDSYFQVVAGEYSTILNDLDGKYGTYDLSGSGMVETTDGGNMWGYIMQNCKDPNMSSRYIVTIKLYTDCATAPPLIDPQTQKQVEFKVYVKR